MVSTGITELDQRLGGLSEGRYYLLTGTPGAGKTSACLHFVAEGVRQGQKCALLTQENPDDLIAQASFVGFDLQSAIASDRVALLQYRLDFSANYARVGNPRAVARELVDALEDMQPARLVVDSMLPFVEAGGVSHGAALALLHAMDELNATAYFTVPGDLGDSFYARLYDPLVSGTAGLLHFEMVDGEVRQVSIRKVRQKAKSTEPLQFLIRPGLGIVELQQPASQPPASGTQNRVALVNSGGHLGGDLYAGLSRGYDLITFTSADEALPHVTHGVGLVVMVIDPRDTDAALSFVRDVRRQSGVPLALISETEGLRSSTRSRAQRAGVDEFLTIDGSQQETLARLEAARQRGDRSTKERLRQERLIVQPRDADGVALPLPVDEVARAARHHMETSAHPFFALVCVRPEAEAVTFAWNALARALRLGDGDLIALDESKGELLLFLHDISRRHARELIERIVGLDPELQELEVVIDHFPADAERVERFLQKRGLTEPVAVA